MPIHNNSCGGRPAFGEYASATISAEQSQAAGESLSKEDYYRVWDQWKKDSPPGGGERRGAAVREMKDALERNSPRLDLSGLGLTKLPNILPPSCEVLDVINNKLTELPVELPPGLTALKLNGNPLPKLPDTYPPSMRNILADRCRLTEIPAALPDGLLTLSVNDNPIEYLPNNLPSHLEILRISDARLTRLPEELPRGLKRLEVSGNLLRALPESILTMPRSAWVLAVDNPFTEEVLETLRSRTSAADYQGPRIDFQHVERPERPERQVSGDLSKVIERWVTLEQKGSTAVKWASIQAEPNAQAFSNFLKRLADTESAKHAPEFKHTVATWLSHLYESPTLRSHTFAIAEGATQSCEDRVALTYNEMKKVAVVHDVENGKYDKNLPKLVALGRETFRLEQLESIASAKVKELKIKDEIEVYLSYQVKLREPLKLTSGLAHMRYFAASDVKQADLDNAQTEVKKKENQDFPAWLANWSPWSSVLQRIEPARYKAANEQKMQMMESHPALVTAELEALGLENDSDAIRIVGKKLFDKMLNDINMALTCQSLEARGSLKLLDEQWNV